jgi:hypothetical protein
VRGWKSLERFLHTDELDAGCAEAFRVLDAYVGRMLAHADAEARFPAVAAHLRVCAPCAEDFRGLLAAVTGGPAG